MADLKAAFANLQVAVAKQATVDASVLTLISGLRQQLTELAQQETIDPSDVQALADSLQKEQGSLSYAVTAGTGTPAAPGTPANPIPQTPIVAPIQQTDGVPSGVAGDAPAVQAPLVAGVPSTGAPTDASTADASTSTSASTDAVTNEVPTSQEQAAQAGEPVVDQQAAETEPASVG